MSGFHVQNGVLHAEGIALTRLAEQVGTPFYCYSRAALTRRYRAFADALAGADVQILYALKANSNQAVIRVLAEAGAGADVVSEGELRRALLAGVPARRIVFAGVGKTGREIAAGLDAGILQFNVESDSELALVDQVARARGVRAPVALRVNPDVDAGTHAKITTGTKENKFGIDIARAAEVYQRAANMAGVKVAGISVHIGSQLTDLAPYRAAYGRVVELARSLQAEGIPLDRVDLGGGLGVNYREERDPPIADYAQIVKETQQALGLPVLVEPGRALVADAGILVARVVHVKQGEAKRFVIIDAAMNDLIRPTLYEAYHRIDPVVATDGPLTPADLVGPICESGDYLALDRALPPLKSGDLIALRTAGAYGAVMASTYNSRGLVPEVLVDGARHAVIRPRQSIDEMIALDRMPDWLG